MYVKDIASQGSVVFETQYTDNFRGSCSSCFPR